jgi:hypothetical protein
MTAVVTLTNGKYPVQNSLRFRSSASAYLNRTPTLASNRTTWTWSGWVKRGKLGATQRLFASVSSNGSVVNINSSDQLQISTGDGTTAYNFVSTAAYRDPSAWYHIVCVCNTTSATATQTGTTTDRLQMWVNGVQLSAFSTNQVPTQNFAGVVNSTNAHYIGQDGASANYLDGYLAEVNFVDGQQLTPTSFGGYDLNGVWQPSRYNGAYGYNGFYLPFTNTTSTATLGNDFSGNGNTWTTNNFSLTAGSTYDSMTDSPTVSSASVANYATWNPINNSTTNSYTFSNGNLGATVSAASGGRGITSTIGMTSTSGVKYYAELTVSAWGGSNNSDVGILNTNTSVMTTSSFAEAGCIGAYLSNGYSISQAGKVMNNGSTLASGLATFANGDIVQIAYDGTYIYFGKNGTWLNSAVPASGTGGYSVAAGTYAFAFGVTSNTSQTGTVIGNFGQRAFTYTAPTGFVALNTANLPYPTIQNGASYMAATTYAGSASTQVINSNLNSLNLAWIKDRTSIRSHVLVDTVRSGSPMLTLYSDLTSAEDNSSANYNPTSISGSSITLGGAKLGINTSGDNYVMWGWSAGSSNVSNTNGSITSTVSVNTTAGFSILTFNSGTAGNKTVGHGLGVTPAMIITKDRTSSNSWTTWHQSLPSATQSYLWLNSTNASANDSRQWANTAPTSSVFSFESGYTFTASDNCVAYCWSAVPGYSAFGSYTGNGSTDGPFVYTGFRPRFVLFKRTDAVNTWLIYDTSRSPYNADVAALYPNSSAAETTDDPIDYLSNGFKMRGTGNLANTSGGTYIYAAFAENPFNSSRAR